MRGKEPGGCKGEGGDGASTLQISGCPRTGYYHGFGEEDRKQKFIVNGILYTSLQLAFFAFCIGPLERNSTEKIL